MLNLTKLGAVILGILLVLNCGPKSGSSQSAKIAKNFVAEVATLDSMTVASLNRTGSYSDIESALKELKSWLESNRVNPAGTPFVFYYDDLQGVPPESCNWAVCIPIPATTRSDKKTGITVSKLPAMIVAWTIHTGGYGNVQDTYDKLLEWIDEEGYEVTGPAVEFFLSHDELPEDSMVTKVGFVVQPQPASELEEEEEEEEGEFVDDEG